jgi:hypothetical protein
MTGTPSPADNTGQSTNTFKWIAIGCGGCLGLTVLLIVALGVLISRSFSISVNSEDVKTNAQELFTYTLPGESQGVLDMDILGVKWSQVSTPESPPNVMLTMGRLPAYLRSEDARQAFVETLQENTSVETNYQFVEQRVEAASLCEQPVSVIVQEGRYQHQQNTYNTTSYLTFVEYDNDIRFAWILAHGEQAAENAEQVFQSLDCQ